MPYHQDHPRFRGITLPPSGWVLAVLLVVYIFVGLIGHDPWKHDDAISIGIAYDIVANGHWLAPQLAGQPYPDAPFYYWLAAGTAHLFSWLLPVHDAARLASGLFTLLAFEFTLLAARELYGKEHAAAAPLILAGSIGFLFHAHEAQPMLAALTAHTAAYWAATLLPRRPRLAAGVFGIAVALGFLANGMLPLLTLLPVSLLSLWQSEHRRRDLVHLALGLLLATAISALWLVPLYIAEPQFLARFLQSETEALRAVLQPASNIARYLKLLLWYAWPALPLAAWSLWTKRRTLGSKAVALPSLAFLAVLTFLGLCVDIRSAPALLLLPPLVLLAVPGVANLRRGAANAFDWFGMMTFTVFAGFAWVAWCAMVFGWPQKLARQVVRLEPGFVGQFDLLAGGFAALATLTWFWLVFTSPRSPMRGIMHWMAGLTLFWLLVATLWMPWIDYGKTYRPLSAELAAAIPAQANCVTNGNLPKSILATLDYFDGIRTVPLSSSAAKKCNWLLVHGEVRDGAAMTSAGWRKAWEGMRPGDRRESDKFHLYRRDRRSRTGDALPELPAPDTVENATRH